MTKPAHVTTHEFQEEVLSSDLPVVVDFWADWCAPCHQIAPVLEELAASYKGRLRVVKVDVDSNAELAQQFSIRSIPTMVFFRDGEIVDQFSGALPKQALSKRFDALVEKPRA